MEKQRARIMLTIGVLGVSLSGILVRLSTQPALIIAFYRLVFTLAFVFLIKTNKKYVSENTLTTPPRSARLLMVLGGVFFAFHLWSWFLSLEYTSVANSTVIVNTQVLFVIILSALFKYERPEPRAIVALLVALLGVVLLSRDGSGAAGNTKGDLLALLGALMIAGYYLCGKILRRYYDTIEFTLHIYGVSAFVLLLFILEAQLPLLAPLGRDWLVFIALAFFSTIVGHMSLSFAMRYLPASNISAATLGEPVIASLLAYLLFDEVLTPLQACGAVITLAGMFFFVRKNKEEH